MKRKTFFTLVAIFVSTISLYLVGKEQAPCRDHHLQLNIDALADGESGAGNDCYDILHNDPTEQVIFCGSCTTEPGRGKRKSVCFK